MSLFKKNSLGIHISDSSIEVVEMIKNQGAAEVLKKAQKDIPSGVVKNGKILVREALEKVLKSLFLSAKIEIKNNYNIFFALPEALVYTRTFSTPEDKTNNYHVSVENELVLSIPLLPDERIFTYTVLESREGKVKILAMVMEKKIIKDWQDFFSSCGLEGAYTSVGILAKAGKMVLSDKKFGQYAAAVGLAGQAFVTKEFEQWPFFGEMPRNLSSQSNKAVEQKHWRLVLTFSILVFFTAVGFFCWGYYPTLAKVIQSAFG